MSNLADGTQDGLDIRAAWTEIGTLAQQLLQHARNREWEAVGELHARRDELIRRFFATPVAAAEAHEVREGIVAMLASDKEIIALTRQERSSAAVELQKLQAGRAAHKAYTNIGNGT